MKNYEDVFIFYSKHQIQQMARNLIDRKLKPLELGLLKANIATEISNLIGKMGSSKLGQIKDILNELKNEKES